MSRQTGHALGKTLLFTTLALSAFAANSVLCRLALGAHSIDAASFTIIRLFSGALVLLAILKSTNNKMRATSRGDWFAGLMLFLYAITFSYAYITLDTGTGALILFGAVQITMIVLSMLAGNRLHAAEAMGVALAFAGFVYLILPGVTTPSVQGFLLMTVAGIAWGIYSLKGRGSDNPLRDTAYNFTRTLPLVIVLAIIVMNKTNYSAEGIVLAALSGGIASGIGYTLWYVALAGLSATQAAVVQLSVPVIAAFGGVLFVGETITLRLTLSALLILGGIFSVVVGRYYFVRGKIAAKV